MGEMKRVYELDVYKLAEELPDMVWYDFDKWNKKVQNTVSTRQTRADTQGKSRSMIVTVHVPWQSAGVG